MRSITLNDSEVMNGSVQPNRNGTMIRCPDEEMGRNGTHALEARIGLIGREIFARARRAEPSPLAMA